MLRNNNHIIQSQSIEIEFQDINDAIGVQNRIAEVFYEKLQPRMEILLDELFGKNYFASIDKLEIDCGLLNKKNWEEEFTGEAIRKLKETLIHVNKKEIDLKKIEETTAAELLFFFLENGFLPWNSRVSAIQELEMHVSIGSALIDKLKEIIHKSEKSAARIVNQFSEGFYGKIISELGRDKNEILQTVFQFIEKLKPGQVDKRIISIALLQSLSAKEVENPVEVFLNFVCKKAGEATLPAIKKAARQIKDDLQLEKVAARPAIKPAIKKEMEEKAQQDPIYIANGGLVLVHPFLAELFEKFQLTLHDQWINENAQQNAALIMQFIATGNHESPEFNLPLNKILCGIEQDESIVPAFELTGEIKNECEQMLNAVISHWKVLKNTGIDSLRETFLQRNGMLTRVDNGWLLQVEQNTVDILLGHLPWGIGIIKLPWMKEQLYTEWT